MSKTNKHKIEELERKLAQLDFNCRLTFVLVLANLAILFGDMWLLWWLK